MGTATINRTGLTWDLGRCLHISMILFWVLPRRLCVCREVFSRDASKTHPCGLALAIPGS